MNPRATKEHNGLCECGCGIPTRVHNGLVCRYRQGHYWRVRNNFDASPQFERLKVQNAVFDLIKKTANGTKVSCRTPRSLFKEIQSKGFYITETSFKRIWGRGYKRGWFKYDWREIEARAKRNLAAVHKWYDKNLFRERARKREHSKIVRAQSPDKIRLRQFQTNLRRSAKHPNYLLTEFCVNLDAPAYESGEMRIMDILPSQEPDPLTALMMKEEAEEVRRHRRLLEGPEPEIMKPAWERSSYDLKCAPV